MTKLKLKLKSGYDLARQWMNHSQVRQYGSSAAWLMAARFYWVATALTVGIYVARVLGPFEFGILNYAIAFVGIFSLIATLGIDGVIIRELTSRPNDRDSILGNFSMFRLISFVLMALALGGTVLLSGQSPQVKWLCLIIGLGYAGYIMQSSQIYFIATVNSQYFAWGQIAACTVHTLVRFCAAFFELPLYVYALAEAGMILTLNGIQLYFYCRYVGSPFRWTFRLKEAAALFAPALPMSISGVLSMIYARTDILMIKYFLDVEHVGYYTIASRFTENWYLLGTLLATNFFPAIISASKISQAAYTKQLHRLYFMCFWVMAAASVVTIVLGHPVIRWLYGEAYLPAVAVLYIYVCTLPGSLVLFVFTQWTTNENLLKTNALTLGAGALLNVIFNYLLIPRYGMAGAACSSLITMPLGMAIVLLSTTNLRRHLRLVFRSIFTLPSFKLGENEEQ